MSSSIDKSMCANCLSLVIEDKCLELEEANSVYVLISLQDRRGLKWPPTTYISSNKHFMNLFVQIKDNRDLFILFLSGPSRRIIVTLTSLQYSK